jgi:putative regulator of septum formation
MDPTHPTDGDSGTPSTGQPPHGGTPGPPSYEGAQQPPYGGTPQQNPYGAPQQPGQPGQGQFGQAGPGQAGPGQPGYPGQPAYQGQPYPGQQYPGAQYGGQSPYPGMPGPYPGQPQKTSVPAILSLIFAVIGGILISIILGVVALTQIPKKGQKGKGLAIAGLAVSGFWLVGIVVAIAVFGDGEPDRDASGQVTTTQNTRPDKLRVGDCVSEINEGEVANIKVVPCNQPNGGKVFAVFDLPAGDWPGLTAVQTAAENGCTSRWKASKQKASAESSIFYLHPTEDGWSLGDRGTTCLLTPK